MIHLHPIQLPAPRPFAFNEVYEYRALWLRPYHAAPGIRYTEWQARHLSHFVRARVGDPVGMHSQLMLPSLPLNPASLLEALLRLDVLHQGAQAVDHGRRSAHLLVHLRHVALAPRRRHTVLCSGSTPRIVRGLLPSSLRWCSLGIACLPCFMRRVPVALDLCCCCTVVAFSGSSEAGTILACRAARLLHGLRLELVVGVDCGQPFGVPDFKI